MLFLELESVDAFWQELTALRLKEKYPEVRLTPASTDSWGKVCFIHDPCGNLWHIGEFF